jgi:hypothetical protein
VTGWRIAAAIASGAQAGADAARHAGHGGAGAPLPELSAPIGEGVADRAYGLVQAVMPAATQAATRGKAFVDFQMDVTTADLRLAQQEGFESVEHLKRYTTLGMGTDQGKTGGLNAVRLMAGLRGIDMEAAGTTTFRPPYTPVSIGGLAGRNVGQHFRPVRRSPMAATVPSTGPRPTASCCRPSRPSATPRATTPPSHTRRRTGPHTNRVWRATSASSVSGPKATRSKNSWPNSAPRSSVPILI